MYINESKSFCIDLTGYFIIADLKLVRLSHTARIDDGVSDFQRVSTQYKKSKGVNRVLFIILFLNIIK